MVIALSEVRALNEADSCLLEATRSWAQATWTGGRLILRNLMLRLPKHRVASGRLGSRQFGHGTVRVVLELLVLGPDGSSEGKVCLSFRKVFWGESIRLLRRFPLLKKASLLLSENTGVYMKMCQWNAHKGEYYLRQMLHTVPRKTSTRVRTDSSTVRTKSAQEKVCLDVASAVMAWVA